MTDIQVLMLALLAMYASAFALYWMMYATVVITFYAVAYTAKNSIIFFEYA